MSDIIRRGILTGLLIFGGTQTLDFIVCRPVHAQEQTQLEQYRKKMFGRDFFVYRQKGLVDRLTPEVYQKNSKKFKEILLEAFHFFNQEKLYQNKEELWRQDKNTTIDQLVQNLSLDGSSLLSSMKTSEEIRQKLKQQNILDFEKDITDYFQKKQEVEKKVQAIKILLPRATKENQTELQKELLMCNAHTQALEKQIQLSKDAMFWLRWHHPNYLKEKVDFKKTQDQYLEALDKLKALQFSLAKKDVQAVINHYVGYKTKFQKANALFRQNISILLKQAETNITQNILGQPLTKIEHQGKLFYAAKEFAQDWEKVQRLLGQKPKIPAIELPLEQDVKNLFQSLYHSLKTRKYQTFRSLYADLKIIPGLQEIYGPLPEYEAYLRKTFNSGVRGTRLMRCRVQKIKLLQTNQLPKLRALANPHQIFAYQCHSKIGPFDSSIDYYIVRQNQELKLLHYIHPKELMKKK
ncbi:MAG: hypothetical protein KAT77_02145 [Nanoarchaeota archaeon]|nr:hypothetical protein [Nanoarchaeota archaeon]